MPNRFLNNININDEYTLPSADGTVDQIITTDGAGQLSFVDQRTINAGNAEHVVIYAKNTHTAPIAKGTPVYITGTVGATDTVEIAPADAGNASHMPAVGLLDDTLAINAFGYVITGGFMDNVTTDPIDGSTPSSNDTVYIKVGGGLTLTKPTGPTGLIQNIAKVGKVSGGNAGSLIVSSILRTNDVPNLTTGKIWVGDGNTTESTVVHLDEPNGRMGIGTTSPSHKLDVDGGAQFNTNTGTTPFYITRLGSTDQALSIKVMDDNVRFESIQDEAADNYGGFDFRMDGGVTEPDFVIRKNAGNPILNVKGDGNVGIGTTSPATIFHISDATTPEVRIQDTTNNRYLSLYQNDSNSYIQSSLNSALVLSTHGANERMRITTAGNVGIGTSSPASALHINKTYPQVRLQSTGDDTYTNIGSGSNYMVWDIINPLTNTYQWRSGGSAQMTINTSGNVGIGTTTPSDKLHVVGASRLQKNGETLNLVGTDHVYSAWYPRGTSNGRKAYMGYGGANTTNFTAMNQDTGAFIIGTNNAERMRIISNGNVGIGTTSPGSKLHVSESASASTADLLYLENTGSGGNEGVSIVFNPMFDATSMIASNREGFGSDATNLSFHTSVVNGDPPIERMRIISGGNVGIGTTSPSNTLHISAPAGSARVTSTAGGANLFLESTTGNLSRVRWNGLANFAIRDDADSQDRLVIDTSGNVGIGTASPSYTLDVTGDAYIDETLNIETTISGTLTYGYGGVGAGNLVVGGLNFASFTPGVITLINQDTTISAGQDLGVLQFGGKDDQTNGYANGQIICTTAVGTGSGNTGGGIFRFLLSGNTSGSGPTERMRITNTGDVGIGTTSPGEKLEVNGVVKATASTDAYKGYIKQTIATIANEKGTATANYNLIPYNTLTTTTSDQYYNRMAAAYDGRIKKVYIVDTGGTTPDATVVNLKKQVNNVTSSTVYSTTVTGSGSGMSAVYNFADNDFTFNAGDTFGILYQTTDSGGGARTMGGVAINIIIEYNIT